jgi:peptide deformylase
MILPILEYPNELLYQESLEVLDINGSMEFIKNLRETLKNSKTGVGLAAPQVGQAVRIFAIRLKSGIEVYINPKIIKKSSKTVTSTEGCLSCPGIQKSVTRAATILVAYRNTSDKAITTTTMRGYNAIIFQHELDHLNGILLVGK